ncbi:MAG: N-formylglutamate amidohydrolase, partial [Ardenticatenaceae bacterium]|nr:N-formylglutamate amidohydrolase [Ardenticatenaceae bacterium]
QVLHWVNFPYARAVLDMNRLDDPARTRPGDGIVKWQTSYGDPVYLPGQQPDEVEERMLIGRYWQAWHEQLAAIAADERVKLVIDAHSMAAVGPSLYGDPGVLRPCVDVANLGDERGEMSEERGAISAPAALAQKLAAVLGQGVGRLAAWAETGEDWALNRPFWGGADLWLHGRLPQTQPWLMVEINRALYIGKQDGNTPIVPPDEERIAALREAVWRGLETAVSSAI